MCFLRSGTMTGDWINERLGYASPFNHPPQTKQQKRNSKAHGNGRSPLNRLAIRPYALCGIIWVLTPFVCRRYLYIGGFFFVYLQLSDGKVYARCCSATKKDKKNLKLFSQKEFVLGLSWWRWSDSNRLPIRCERIALPGELHPRVFT